MSLFSSIGDAFNDVVHVGEDVLDVAGSVAKDMAEGAVNSLEHTFDSPFSVLKGIAFATVLAPVSMAMTAYELGDAIYTETDKKINEK